MVQYLAKRIGRSVLTLFIIVTLVFCLLRLMPVEGYFANYEKMSEAQIQAGLQAMGLLDPLPVQVGRFWRNALHGDLGVSHIYKVNAPVTQILAQKLPISIQMGVLAMLLSLVLGIPLGLVMGQYKGRWPDKLGTALIVLIQAVPAAVYFLYIQMYGTAAVGVGLLFNAANWRYWVLPVCSMSLANLAFYAMWLRRYMVDESNKDYVRLARAKGVCGRDIALHHVFRNAMVPLVQYIPSAFLNTVVGSIYIESLYSIPGMGGLLVTCVQRHDNTMVQGIVLLYACVGIVGLILGDILMVLIDPRHQFWQEGRWPLMFKRACSRQLEAQLNTLQRDGPAAWATLPEEELFTPAGFSSQQAEATASTSYSYWGSTFRAFFKNKLAVALLAALAAVVVFAFVQPLLPGQADPNLCAVDPATGIQYRNIAPGQQGFLWGSNSIGQDLWARIWAGARTSLTIAFFVAVIEAAVGITAGVLWGYVRGLDFLFTELYNIFDNIPTAIVLILISYVATPSIWTMILGMSIKGWIEMARFIRNQILIIRDRDYNVASRCIGTPTLRIVLRNLLPYLVSVIMLRMALTIPEAIGNEVFITYIGLGLSVETPSLGNLVNDGRKVMMQAGLRYQLLYPTLILSFVTIAFYLIGNAFSDAADPKNHLQ